MVKYNKGVCDSVIIQIEEYLDNQAELNEIESDLDELNGAYRVEYSDKELEDMYNEFRRRMDDDREIRF